MIRASFTVVTKSLRYDANHISIVRGNRHDGDRWWHESDVVFVSSGGLVTLPAADVQGIEFHEFGAHWCSECDGSLNSVVGKSAETDKE